MLHAMFNRTTSVLSNVALVSLTPVLFRVLSGLDTCPDRISGENHISEKYRACYYNVIIAGFGADCFRVKIRSFNLGCGKPES